MTVVTAGHIRGQMCLFGLLAGSVWVAAIIPGAACAQGSAAAGGAARSGVQVATVQRYGFDLSRGMDAITERWWAPNILEVHLLLRAHAGPNALVLNPRGPF